ncbi:MAG: ABC transporter permease [Chlorobi bacterium]|nr:ABC transporter permease [Chlorobiota bacterium]
MKLEATIALRYIRNQRAIQFSGIIAGLALVGITIGVAAVICVASIFLGFRQLFEDLMLRVDPHVRIVSRTGKYLDMNDAVMRRIVEQSKNIVVPVLDGKAVALHRGAMHVLTIRGYCDSLLPRLSRLRDAIVVGSIPRHPGDIVIGGGAAERLGILPGDTIELISAEYARAAAIGFGVPATLRARVTGMVLTNDRAYDDGLALTTQSTAAELFATSADHATALDIFCNDRTSGFEVLEQLRNRLGQRYRVEGWRDLHREMYAVMEWERVVSFILLSLIVLLAVFNIVAMLMMTVASKRRDIAVLRTLGARQRVIGNIFRIQGLIVALVGTVLGAIVGIGLCWGQQRYHWILLDPDRYVMQELPVVLDWGALIGVIIVSIGAAFLASLPAARRAIRTSVVESLRFE